MRKYNDSQVKALIKNFPYIKFKENVYIIFEKPSHYGKNIKDYFNEIVNSLYNFISAPFLFIYYTFRYIRTFLPMLIIRDKKKETN